LELKWINSLVEKKSKAADPYLDGKNLWDNFNFNKIFDLQLGQGFRFDVVSNNIKDKLTRFQITLGMEIDGATITASEYYFWKEEGHIFTMDFNQKFNSGDLGFLVNYNTFIRPANQNIRVYLNIAPIELLKIRAHYDYDFANLKTNDFLIGTLFSPPNDCWKLDLSYRITQIDRKFSFNIHINYNQKAFGNDEF